jgi:hypothetical protein
MFTDITDIFRFVFIGKSGSTGGDSDVAHLGQVVDDFLGNTVTEMFLVLFRAQIFECEHGYGKLGISHGKTPSHIMEGANTMPAKLLKNGRNPTACQLVIMNWFAIEKANAKYLKITGDFSSQLILYECAINKKFSQ